MTPEAMKSAAWICSAVPATCLNHVTQSSVQVRVISINLSKMEFRKEEKDLFARLETVPVITLP
jgi:hypothetical protein